MVDKTKLQIADPLEFCSANNISYKGLNVYLLDTTKAADVAMILYKVVMQAMSLAVGGIFISDAH